MIAELHYNSYADFKLMLPKRRTYATPAKRQLANLTRKKRVLKKGNEVLFIPLPKLHGSPSLYPSPAPAVNDQRSINDCFSKKKQGPRRSVALP